MQAHRCLSIIRFLAIDENMSELGNVDTTNAPSLPLFFIAVFVTYSNEFTCSNTFHRLFTDHHTKSFTTLNRKRMSFRHYEIIFWFVRLLWITKAHCYVMYA